MSSKRLLNHYFVKYPRNVSYCYCLGANWVQKAKEAGIPEEPGVYMFLKDCLDTQKIRRLLQEQPLSTNADGASQLLDQILYIGKSGTMINGNGFKKQKLYGRIAHGKQFKGLRYKTVPARMRKDHICRITILWFVTHNKTINDLPGYVEGILMQEYYDSTKRANLPMWNAAY